MGRLSVPALVAALLVPMAGHAETCQRYGNVEYCDNGLNSQTYGDSTCNARCVRVVSKMRGGHARRQWLKMETAMSKFFVLTLVAALSLPAAAQAGACWRAGQSVHCDNGVSSSQTGSTTHYSTGHQCCTMGKTCHCN